MAGDKIVGEERSGNQSVEAPESSERELSRMRVADLRERARQLGVAGVSRLRKAELIKAVKNAYRKASKRRGGGAGTAARDDDGDRPASQSVGAPESSERELSRMRMADLRERARQLGVAGVSRLRKAELIKAVKNAYRKASKRRGGGAGTAARDERDRNDGSKPQQVEEQGLSPEASLRVGAEAADSPESSQEITSADDEQDRS